MDNHIFFMQQAIIEAKKAYEIMEVPVGAVIVKDGQIIGKGYNKKETKKNPVSHAEIEAIQQACLNNHDWRLNGSILYVTAEPCIMCAGAIMHARIDKVIFGVKEPKFGGIISKDNIFDKSDLNHSVTYEYGILEDEISNLMKLFFQKLRQKEPVKKSL